MANCATLFSFYFSTVFGKMLLDFLEVLFVFEVSASPESCKESQQAWRCIIKHSDKRRAVQGAEGTAGKGGIHAQSPLRLQLKFVWILAVPQQPLTGGRCS